jgi:hypothetical protein
LSEFTRLGLATNFEIFSWQDIKDIAFKEEIFGSKVTVIPFTGENLTIDYIPKVQARKLYQLIKEALENAQEADQTPEAPIVVETRTEVKAPTINELYKQEAAKRREAELKVVEASDVVEEESPVLPQPEPEAIKPFIQPEPVIAAAIPPKEEEDELTLKLKKLKNLYDKQLITQAEYESKKAEILSQL